MEIESAYIPIDRRQEMLRNKPLPERTQGAALFADISGFTPLTEALERELGPKRGAEELTVHLNRVYDALVAEVHRFGGSVISFSGDAITCWFDGDDGRRATASGLAMQAGMDQFTEVRTHSGRIVSLGMKAAVAAGAVRRFLVGDPDYVMIDAMAGKTIQNLASAEHQAERGDVILDPAAAAAIADQLEITEWRQDEASGESFAVVTGLKTPVPPMPWPDFPDEQFSTAQKSAWVLPPVHQRLNSGQGMFLAELRPAAALFMKFGGINYDEDDDAPHKLDVFIRGVEKVLMRYEGSLLQLTIGDKGSYLYAAFGAPIAHEDDPVRIGAAALELLEFAQSLPFLSLPQIGITLGRMRTGAYGSVRRRTYGVLGDNVNLSARLMAASKPGQIFVSDTAREAMGDHFIWEQLDNIRVKGKSEPISISRLVGLKKHQTTRLQEPRYTLPMVGRTAELAQIAEKIDQALMGRGQIVGITAEAGMGKSRLASEVIRLALDKNLEGYAGECQSYGTETSYLVWQGVWRNFFGLDSSQSVEAQIETTRQALQSIDPSLVVRLPLLSPVLNLSIPDNDLTASLDAKVRKTSLEGMLVTCLQARARVKPLLIVLEDCHWLDPLSNDLIAEVGRAVLQLPVLLLLVYRPPDAKRLQQPKVSQLSNFTEIALGDFTAEEAERLITLKLHQFFGEDKNIPADFVDTITDRAAGNPFYIEEIINYLKDLGVDPQDSQQLKDIDLPTSIYSLILSRIDQLNQRQQITIRVASVIGRLFKAAMVWGVYPELGKIQQIQTDLEILSDLELTPLDQPDPELVYLFKHVMTQEIAYESLLYATRAQLHDQIGQYLERIYPQNLERYIPLLAYHYEHSENEPKKREYLLKAARAAKAEFANTTAINYLNKLLPILPEEEQGDVHFMLGEVLDTIGDVESARETFARAMSLADRLGDPELHLKSKIEYGDLFRKQSNYEQAHAWFDEALDEAERIGNQWGVAKVLTCKGTMGYFQGDFDAAKQHYEAGLAQWRALDDQTQAAKVLTNLGAVSRSAGAIEQSRAYQEEAISLWRALNNKFILAISLNNLGNLVLDRGQKAEARRYLEEAVAIQREVGYKWYLANALNNLGNVAREQGDFTTASNLYREAIQIYQGLGDQWALAYLLEDSGLLAAAQGLGHRALTLVGSAQSIREAIKAVLSAAEQERLDLKLATVREAMGDQAQAAWDAGKVLSMEKAIEYAFNGHG